MAFVEIFEMTIHESNRGNFEHVTQQFSRLAPSKVPGLEKMEFWSLQDNPKVYWQFNHWKEEAAMKNGLKFMFAMPEMSGVAVFLEYPPKRINNLVSSG